MDAPEDTVRPPLTPAAAARLLIWLNQPHAQAATDTPAIHDYLVDRELGRGAGGITYLAHKPGADARVALKVIPLQKTSASQRAWRELDALQQVRVPNVPRLLDFGAAGDSLYIATEFIDGTPLDRLYNAPPADLHTLRDRVRLLEHIARAAHTLHEQGIIHRDLKPSNIIVTHAAEPYILDLGIALIDAPDLHRTLTHEGQPVGTPAFMAPEQARGTRDLISTRSDVYSLGAIGCWLATGQTPHDLADVTLHEAIRRVGSDPPREPRAISTQIPKPLSAVLAKACAPRPTDRYASAAALADDIARWCAGHPVEAVTPNAYRRVTYMARRHPVATTAAGCALLLTGSIIGSVLTATWMSTTPVRVHNDIRSGAAALLTSSGRILRTFNFTPFSNPPADIVDSARGPLLVVATATKPGDPWQTQQLCVGSVANLAAPAWATSPNEPESGVPDSPWTRRGAVYTVSGWTHADVFPEHPGEEVVTTHTQANHPSMVRVLSLDGDTLFEAWHLGSISMPLWVDAGRYLVVTGCDGAQPIEVPDRSQYFATMLAALRPELDAHWGWINGRDKDPSADVLWYKHLSPYDIASPLDLQPVKVYPHAPGCEVVLNVRMRNDPAACFSWHLDRKGNVLPSSVTSGPGDLWRTRYAEFPIHLIKLRQTDN